MPNESTAVEIDEAAFLENYREKQQYPAPAVSVDLVILTIVDGVLMVLLVKRREHPFQGQWCLPGGFVRVGDAFEHQGESVEEAAAREMEEETGLSRNDVYLEQLYTFGAPYRDPRMRVITVAHFALVRPDLVPQVKAGTDASDARWYTMDALPGLAFDHASILETAVERIGGKIDYTDIAFDLVPSRFTIPEVREVFEIVKGEAYDPSNFRRRFKRLVEDGLVVELDERRHTGARPARVYQFRSQR